ncbi:MAG: maleate cis-trans isomerase [Betaproteobacteria bacterium]|nr:maleate cis-trans isomerase [Betaproteobacteria bacterium]
MDTNLANRQWPRPRARIGLIIPSVNTLTEPQFFRYAPRDVELHVTRNRIELERSLIDQLPAILDAASLLADCGADLIVYHCTGMSMGSGKAQEAQMVEAIRKTTGKPSTSTATAIINAFRVLGTRKVMLATPYAQVINDLEKKFLAEHGIEVLRDRALDLPIPEGMCGATPDVWIQTVMEMRDPQADAYFLSCTNIQSVDAVTELEQRLGKPVVTSNQASLWYALRRCGIEDTIPGLGRLMGMQLPSDAAADQPLAA